MDGCATKLMFSIDGGSNTQCDDSTWCDVRSGGTTNSDDEGEMGRSGREGAGRLKWKNASGWEGLAFSLPC